MLGMLTETVGETETSNPYWWTYIGGPVVIGAVLTGIFGTIQTIVNKKKSPPSIIDQTQLLLDGLQSMVSMMTEDKAKDSERIDILQSRIEELETLSIKDYDMISRMRDEQHDMQNDILRKSRMINELVHKLKEMSIIVEGIEESYSETLIFKEM